MKNKNIDRYSNLIYSILLHAFDDQDPDRINPDEINDIVNFSALLYSVSIKVPQMLFNDLATRKVSEQELHKLVGELIEEYKNQNPGT